VMVRDAAGRMRVDFLRHSSGVRRRKNAPAQQCGREASCEAPSAHRRPGYPLLGCVPAEPNSVSPGGERITLTLMRNKSNRVKQALYACFAR
jgi:hypothetical protein